jgi:ABC-type multidrug transport system fused ATPase/permease subunit
VRAADRAIVLVNARIADEGTPSALSARAGAFSDLFEAPVRAAPG